MRGAINPSIFKQTCRHMEETMSKKDILLKKVKLAVDNDEKLLEEVLQENLKLFISVYKHTCSDFNEYYACDEKDGEVLINTWEHSFSILEAYGIKRNDVKKLASCELEKIIFRDENKSRDPYAQLYPGKHNGRKVLTVYYGSDLYAKLLENVLTSLAAIYDRNENMDGLEWSSSSFNAYNILVSVLDKISVSIDDVLELFQDEK